MPSRFDNAGIAIALAALPLPAVKLLDYANKGCGDGLCGFIPGLLLFGGLFAGTLVFVVRSARRQETPAVLRLVPFVLWALAIVPLIR